MKKYLRIVSISLLILTGINALVAGTLFILDPSGQKMGLSVNYLKFSPFRSFLIPGIILFIVNGLLNGVTAIACLQNRPLAPLLTLLQGVLLGGWIVVQVIMVRDINILHIVMFTIGALLVVSGVALWRMGTSRVVG